MTDFDKARAVWMKAGSVFMIDQRKLPYKYEVFEAENCAQTCEAIKNMTTRGAGSIGAAAAFAVAQAATEAKSGTAFETNLEQIRNTRPTARNLFDAIERVSQKAEISVQAVVDEAKKYAEETAQAGKKIGEYGNALIPNNSTILTHCNAGWLALQAYGSALAPVYKARESGKEVCVYADETRPRSQGARLTAWELQQASVPHYIIPDNAAAFFMSRKKIDLLITGADRIAANGDTANKIGTLEKALAAAHYGIPFYVAAPLSTFDFSCPSGDKIPIENRSEEEVLFQEGPDTGGQWRKISVASPGSSALNPAFDVSPVSLITAFITEKGIFKPSEIAKLYDE